jgi:hypothetical protein
MPNWCNNVVTLTAPNKEAAAKLIEQVKKSDEIDTPYEILNTLRPRPESEEDNWYSWNVDNWGTKWDVTLAGYEIVDTVTVTLSFDSAWAPPIALYEYLEEEGWSVEAFYVEEGMGYCGKYEDGYDNFVEYAGMTADEIVAAVPDDVDDMFMISEYRREQEAEENEND